MATSRSSRRSAPRRPTAWAGMADNTPQFSINYPLAPLGSVPFVTWTTAQRLTGANPTLVRIRGNASFHIAETDEFDAPRALSLVAGIYLGQQGIDPLVQPEADWLWFHQARLELDGFQGICSADDVCLPVNTVAAFWSPRAFERVTIDSKSMRKWQPEESLFFCVRVYDIDSPGGGHVNDALQTNMYLRTLIKE